MRLQHILATLPVLVLAIEHREFSSPVARGSDAALTCKQNGCKCQRGAGPGQICGLDMKGGDWIIIDLGTDGSWDHIYECNPNGRCCDYGYATKCHALGEEKKRETKVEDVASGIGARGIGRGVETTAALVE